MTFQFSEQLMIGDNRHVKQTIFSFPPLTDAQRKIKYIYIAEAGLRMLNDETRKLMTGFFFKWFQQQILHQKPFLIVGRARRILCK